MSFNIFKAKRRTILKTIWKVVVVAVIISMVGFYMRILYTLTLGKEESAVTTNPTTKIIPEGTTPGVISVE